VSPSRRGVKIFFLYRDDDLDEFRRITGTKWSRNFKERMDSHHPPGFELHLGHRYFAITGDLYDGCPASMRLVEAEDIRWLIQEMGARFAKATTVSSNGTTHGGCANSHADSRPLRHSDEEAQEAVSRGNH